MNNLLENKKLNYIRKSERPEEFGGMGVGKLDENKSR